MPFQGGAGKKDRRIVVQELPDPNGPKNSFGELTEFPADLFECWAAYEPAGGREFPQGQKRFAEVTARFRIDYRRDLNPQEAPEKYRVLYIEDRDSSPWVLRIYDIKAVEVIGRREELHLQVQEVR